MSDSERVGQDGLASDYESDRLVAEYLLFHYGAEEDVLPWPCGPRDALNFARRCAVEGPNHALLPSGGDALDLGCAVGRSSFELAALGYRCTGIDYSHRFIETANLLLAEGSVEAEVREEGEQMRRLRFQAPKIDSGQLEFRIGDAQCLPREIGSYDLVLACNVLCRLARPQDLLARFSSLVSPGGQLFVTTPCTWLEAHTDKRHWLPDVSTGTDTFAAIRQALEEDFTLLRKCDMPFLIREHARKFQWSMAMATLWCRN